MQRVRAKRYATIVVTFSFALGIGFVMQNGDVLASRLGVDSPADGLKVSSSTYTPVRASGITQPLGSRGSEAAKTTIPVEDIVPDMTSPSADDGANAGCSVGFDAAAAPAAMVKLNLNAPCHPESLVTIQHKGMKFNEMTDTNGQLVVEVPALSEEAFFLATVAGEAGVGAITGVPDIALYDRAILQWRGNGNLQLHALEFGADHGGDGHVSAESFGSPVSSVDGARGFLTRLGSNMSAAPLHVEVYTYPSGMSMRDGNVSLFVEAAVTPTNCGRQFLAQSIQLRPDSPPAARRMTLKIPACDTVGEILVLKNMFEDLTLAAR